MITGKPSPLVASVAVGRTLGDTGMGKPPTYGNVTYVTVG
jgi:hypothetical protein